MATQTVEMPALEDLRPRQVDQAVEFGRFQAMGFQRAVKGVGIIQDAAEEAAMSVRSGELAAAFTFDSWMQLHSLVPKDSGFGSPLGRELVKRMSRSEKYEDLRQSTVGDALAAAIAASAMVRTVVSQLDKDLKEQSRREREKAARAEEAEQYLRAMEEEAANRESASPPTSEEMADAREQAAKAREEAAAAAAELVQEIKGRGAAIGKAVSAAVAGASSDAAAVRAACESFGPGTGVVGGGVPPQEKMKLAAAIMQKPFLAQLLEVLGRLLPTAMRKQSDKFHHEAGEIVDVALGSDLANAMDEELADLVSPRPPTRLLALARFVEDCMFEHEVENKEPKGKGDFVVLIDESGSMSGPREAEAKAIAIAILHVAGRQKRGAVVHFFQGAVTHTVRFTRHDFAKGTAMQKVLDVATRGTAGGTSFDAPLAEACKTVRDGTLREADVVMITDGVCDVNPKTIETLNLLRSETQAKIYALVVGCAAGEAVPKFTDKYWSADSLMNSGAAMDLFDHV